jgi:hypothetical protein
MTWRTIISLNPSKFSRKGKEINEVEGRIEKRIRQ